MSLQDLTSTTEFLNALNAAGDNLVVLDCYATWCGPCKKLAPELKKLAAEHANVHFYKLDVELEEVADIVEQYQIKFMPTFLYFKNGRYLDTVLGANIAKIAEAVVKYTK